MSYDYENIYNVFKEIESQVKHKVIKSNYKRLSINNKNEIKVLTDKFNTIWHNINIEKYFIIGFNLYKSFSIKVINNPKIIIQYISEDKRQKRLSDTDKTDIMKSITFIKEKNISLKDYCFNNKNIISNVIYDYIKNHINSIMLCYFIEIHRFKLKLEEKDMVSYFMMNYDDIKKNMYRFYPLIKDELG